MSVLSVDPPTVPVVTPVERKLVQALRIVTTFVYIVKKNNEQARGASIPLHLDTVRMCSLLHYAPTHANLPATQSSNTV